MKKFIFEKNEYDDAFNYQVDEKEIKYYPGSVKGPLPEDDPDYYAQWFIDN